MIFRWLRRIRRIRGHRRSSRRPYRPRRLSRRSAHDAYCRALWPDRRSSLAHEIIRIPAYARTGQRAPHRFEWRGHWYRVVDVGAVWRDERKDHPRRTYFAIVTERGELVQLCFELQGKEGCWKIYRRVSTRLTSGWSVETRSSG